MKSRKLLPLLILSFALVFTMCSKDDDEIEDLIDEPIIPAYVGSWESGEITLAGQPGKMVFNIDSTSFQVDGKLIIGTVTANALGIKGDITVKDENTLSISLTDIGQVGEKGYDYKNRVDNPVEFEGLYQALVAAYMPKDFDADYVVDANTLTLTIDDDIVYNLTEI